jgi:hypothetical protein
MYMGIVTMLCRLKYIQLTLVPQNNPNEFEPATEDLKMYAVKHTDPNSGRPHISMQ